MRGQILFLKLCYYIGAVADLMATVPLMFPRIGILMFGLEDKEIYPEYAYISRIGASLMLGWTLLLIWGSNKPVERRGVLLLTIIPVVTGLAFASALVVASGSIYFKSMILLWIFYALIIPMYLVAFRIASKL